MHFILTIGEQSRTLDWDTMPIADAIECERVTGWTYIEWRKALLEDRAQAIAYAWYLAGRREGADVGKFADLLTDSTLDLGTLRIEPVLTDDERAIVEADEEPDEAQGPTGPDQEEIPAT